MARATTNSRIEIAAAPAEIDLNAAAAAAAAKMTSGAPSHLATRRRSITGTGTKPVMDEHTVFDWEIDPRKLKLKYSIGKGNFG